LKLARFLHGQLFSAFGAAARQNSSPLLGAHATTKAMRLGAMAFFRLICSFRHMLLARSMAEKVLFDNIYPHSIHRVDFFKS
jgi:hypothetical protein